MFLNKNECKHDWVEDYIVTHDGSCHKLVRRICILCGKKEEPEKEEYEQIIKSQKEKLSKKEMATQLWGDDEKNYINDKGEIRYIPMLKIEKYYIEDEKHKRWREAL